MQRGTSPSSRRPPLARAHRFATRCVATYLAIGALPASAQEANYQDIIVGGRAAAYGGAFTAVADDASAALHNPAGLAQLHDHSLSASISAYGIATTTTENVFVDSQEPTELSRTDVQIFPGATGYVFPLKGGNDWSHTLAATILVIDFLEFEGAVDLSSPDLGLTTNVFDKSAITTLYAGPSYGFRWRNLFVGASAFLQYTQLETRNFLSFTADIDGAISRFASFETLDAHIFGLVGVVGAMYQLDRWKLGVSAELPNIRLGGSATSFVANAESLVIPDPTNPEASLYQDIFPEVSGRAAYKTPAKLSIGTSVSLGRFMIAGDVDMHFPVGAYNRIRLNEPESQVGQPGELPGLEEDREVDNRSIDPGREFTVNASLGGRAPIVGDYSILMGVFTDFSGLPTDFEALSEGAAVDFLGGSVAVARTRPDSEFLLGITGRYGWGATNGVTFTDRTDIKVDVREWSMSLFIAGQAKLGG